MGKIRNKQRVQGATRRECRLKREQEFHDVVRSVLKRHPSITLPDVLTKKRTPAIVAARHEIVRHLFAAGWGFPAIGERLGIHHSTAIYAVERGRSST